MQRVLRFLLFFLFALLIYILVLPWVALLLDQRFGLVWRLPFWIEPIAVLMVLSGLSLSLRYCWIRVFQNDTVSTSSGHIVRTAEPGVLTRARNGAIFGGWLCGLGLASMLRSPCLLGFVGIIMLVGAFYIQRPEEPALMNRFVRVIHFINRTPRWIMLLLVAAVTAAGFPAITEDKQSPPAIIEPAILVQVHCKPGTATLWKADFDKHIKPAIEEAIAHGNTYTGFQFIQATLPWQSFDFILLYTGKTFAALDRPNPPPQYVALFQREGSLRGLAVLKEMSAYEDQVSVTLIYSNVMR
jgi:protein-S-isoprenylcysteine O-methyltransferase Ste14